MRAQTRNLGNEHQRQFAKLFDAASQRNNRWTVFADFVKMAAISISNIVDKEHAEEREKDYARIVKSYNEKELTCFTHMLAEITLGLDFDQDQDFLGTLFMNLEISNKYRGQYFTPYNISKMMALMLTSKEGLEAQIKEQGWIGVNDPACGAGGMLVAFANVCRSYGINYQSHVLFVGQDVDFVAGCMCYLQMSLLGCPGYVVIANTITDPATSLDHRYLIPTPTQNVWYTPFYFREEWHYRRLFTMMDCLFSAETPNDANIVTQPEARPDSSKPAPKSAAKLKHLPQPKASPDSSLLETKTGQLTLF